MNALEGQTVVVLGGSSGIGLETARLARESGAEVMLTGRDSARLDRAGVAVGAARTARLDLGDTAGLESFFGSLPAPIDHVLVTGGGPTYETIAELDLDAARRVLDEHLLGSLRVARCSAGRVRPGGSLTLLTGSHARRPAPGLTVAAIAAASVPVIAANAAVELAPIRVNAVAAGFVDTPLSARLLGDQLDERKEELRQTLPIRRVVSATDVAATILHLMLNTAVTGATFDVDGGQQLIA
ncbi:SDR family oxidoreductase [Kribbella ginsengisoli]|uniref:SDR family oxidoreductase n=1 Tax=Kribbella ginsengisoli TaxID=363865 RepID=A0ABP6Z768_9ACTN